MLIVLSVLSMLSVLSRLSKLSRLSTQQAQYAHCAQHPHRAQFAQQAHCDQRAQHAHRASPTERCTCSVLSTLCRLTTSSASLASSEGAVPCNQWGNQHAIRGTICEPLAHVFTVDDPIRSILRPPLAIERIVAHRNRGQPVRGAQRSVPHNEHIGEIFTVRGISCTFVMRIKSPHTLLLDTLHSFSVLMVG